ncbi:MAG: hypothetical protein U1E50_00155 [Caulobacteraceae bacterium]
MGVLHRRVEIATRQLEEGASEARACVEDDFHHFRLWARARFGQVVNIKTWALRNPTNLCPAAGERVSDLIAMPLNEASAAVNERADARQQCTHQFDLAGLAIAALARKIPRRTYKAAIPDRIDGATTATLWRDGEEILKWAIDGNNITGPDPYSGISLGGGFTGFARNLPTLDEAEASLVLRRAVFITTGRRENHPDRPVVMPTPIPGAASAAAQPRTGPMGGCWVWQPERAPITIGNDNKQDFTDRPEVLTADDQDWLAFVD